MIRKIAITGGKGSGNRQYICAGNNCEACKFKFTCFTVRKEDMLLLDWNAPMFNGNDSPSRKLQRITSSKVYVRGSKKYIKLEESLVDKEMVAHIDYFFYQDGLTLPDKNERKRQQLLTQALFRCKPHIVEFDAPFTEEISGRLALPIAFESFGAKACDKRI